MNGEVRRAAFSRTIDDREPFAPHFPPHSYLVIIASTAGKSRRRAGWQPGAGRGGVENAIADLDRLDVIVNAVVLTLNSYP